MEEFTYTTAGSLEPEPYKFKIYSSDEDTYIVHDQELVKEFKKKEHYSNKTALNYCFSFLFFIITAVFGGIIASYSNYHPALLILLGISGAIMIITLIIGCICNHIIDKMEPDEIFMQSHDFIMQKKMFDDVRRKKKEEELRAKARDLVHSWNILEDTNMSDKKKVELLIPIIERGEKR